MTALQLFFFIALGILLQIAVYSLVAFYRHWLTYQELKQRLTDPEPVPVGYSPGIAWAGFREFLVKTKRWEDAGRNVCSFHLVPGDGGALPGFVPGQFLTFKLTLPGPEGGPPREVVRCYSLSDRPGLDHYRVTIKRVPGGAVSNHFHAAVQEGHRLLVQAPGGHFCPVGGETPLVLIAGGIGITPMLSMIDAALESGSRRKIWLFYGLGNSSEHVMKDHLETLARHHANFHLRVCYSRPLPQDTPGRDFHHAGRVDLTLLRLTLPLAPYHFYVCGPPVMLSSIPPALEEWGVPAAKIHCEAFGPTAPAPPRAANLTASISVTFSQTGQSLPWQEETGSLLRFAEKHGIYPASGCRAGSCGTCQTVIEKGEVEYAREPEFVPAPGSCLICVSRPKGHLTLRA